MVEVVRHQDEIGSIHFAVVIEIAVVPGIHDRLIKRRRQQVEVGAIHLGIQIGVALQRVHDLNLVGRQICGIVRIGRIRIAEGITGIGPGGARDDPGSVPGPAVVAGGDFSRDRADRIGAAAVVDEEFVVGEIERAATRD